MEMTIQEYNKRKDRSFKLILIFAMVSMFMVFAGLTSAYVVSKSRPDWLTDFKLPIAFVWSTCTVVISSIVFYLAQKSIAKDDKKTTTRLLYVTLALGFLFVYLQFKGFEQVIANGYFFTGSYSNVTTSFLYVVVIAHLAHLLGGIIALLIVIYKQYKNKYSKENYLGIELGAWFWHFLGLLWVFLFLFFYFYK